MNEGSGAGGSEKGYLTGSCIVHIQSIKDQGSELDGPGSVEVQAVDGGRGRLQ
jgi:hypothetical protein